MSKMTLHTIVDTNSVPKTNEAGVALAEDKQPAPMTGDQLAGPMGVPHHEAARPQASSEGRSRVTGHSHLQESLRQLGKKFLDASEEFGLRNTSYCPSVLMVHVGCGQERHEREYLEYLEVSEAKGWRLAKRQAYPWCSGQVDRSVRTLLFRGPAEWWQRYLDLTDDTAWILAQLSSDKSAAISNATRLNRADSYGWLWSLFDVAWSKQGGASLRTQKEFFLLGGAKFPHDIEYLRTSIKRGKWQPRPPEELLTAAEKLPDIYFSNLDDVFLRSAYFCDWLRAEPGNDTENADR